MIGINGKAWDDVKSSDIKLILERINGEDSIFDESTFFEWKADKESSSKLAKEICAFSNTFGGYVFIGINDDRTIGGCEQWTEQRIHTTVFDSITPTPQIDVKRFVVDNKIILVVRVEEGAVPPYITNEGRIYSRLSSGSFPIKDATSLANLIEKRRDTIRKIAEKIEMRPIEIGKETPANLCAYIDVGFATTLSESRDAGFQRFDSLNYEKIANKLKEYSKEFGISRIGTSLFFTIGNMTGKTDDGRTLILAAGIQFFMELMVDGSVRYRIPLSFDVNSKMNSCNITGVATIINAFTDVYEMIFGKSFADLFIYAYKYQKLTVLKQFRPYYYLNEQNDPETVKRIRQVETLHQEKYGSNVIVEGNRIPPDKFGLIDRHLFAEHNIPYESHELIAVLFSSAYENLGFVENPFNTFSDLDIEQPENNQ